MKDINTGKIKIHELTELAIISALMVGLKESMNALPNIHPTVLLIIIAARVYGYKSLYSTIGFVIIESLLYGLNIWNLCYLYIWPLYTIAAVILKKNSSKLFWSIYAAICGLVFGALSSLVVLILNGFNSSLAYWLSGITFDLIHCTSNFVIVFLLINPLYNLVNRIKKEKQ